MITILAVDDELPIRQWLEIIIKKINGDNASVVTASNGEKALKLYNEIHPDLIFTDIKMPVLDGLELTRIIRETNKNIPIIILTSYGEFELARKALLYNATDYIQKKEINEDTLRSIIDKYSHLQKTFSNKNITCLQLTVPEFYKKISNLIAIENYFFESIDFSILNRHTPFFCIAVSCNNIDGFKLIKSSTITSLFAIGLKDNVIILCNIISSEKSDIQISQYVNEYMKSLETANSDNSCYFCYSKKSEDISHLPEMIKQITNDLPCSFYHNHHSFYVRDTFFSPKTYIQQFSLLSDEISYHIDLNDASQVLSLINNFLDYINTVMPIEVDFIKNKCIDLCIHLYQKNIENSSVCLELCNNISTLINESKSFSTIKSYIIAEFKRIYDINHENNTSTMSKAINYISQNYSTIQGISDVADNVNLNTDFFSKLFKETIGISFNSYLNNYKLEQAYKLILTTNEKLSDISRKVGFSSLSYFSKVFKNKYGISPKKIKTN